jgi:hypothetical protein
MPWDYIRDDGCPSLPTWLSQNRAIVWETQPLLDPYFLSKSCHQLGILANSVPCNRDSEAKRTGSFYSVTGQWWANFQGKIIQATVVLRHRSVTTLAMFYMRTLQVIKESGLSFPFHCGTCSFYIRALSVLWVNMCMQSAAKLRGKPQNNHYKLDHAPHEMISQQIGEVLLDSLLDVLGSRVKSSLTFRRLKFI